MFFRTTALRCGLAIVALAAVTAATRPSAPAGLFFIERSKNANIVRFDARLTKQGTLDAKKPIDAYWLMLAEDGRREELTGLEKRFAYGYEVLPGATPSAAKIRLTAVPGRELLVRKGSSHFAAELDIAGMRSRLVRIYVTTKEGPPLPKVVHIDLYGVSLQTRKMTHERLAP